MQQLSWARRLKRQGQDDGVGHIYTCCPNPRQLKEANPPGVKPLERFRCSLADACSVWHIVDAELKLVKTAPTLFQVSEAQEEGVTCLMLNKGTGSQTQYTGRSDF